MKIYMIVCIGLITMNCGGRGVVSNVKSSMQAPTGSTRFAGVTLSKPLPKDPNLAVKSPVISTPAKTAPKPSSKNVKNNSSTATTTRKTSTLKKKKNK